jgi:2-hydroxy-3-keto-5-methylthiopentenyl-1-phosphate phosphatase
MASTMGPAERALLVTDFDGTLTRNDFFRLVVEEFAPAGLAACWEGYRAGRLTHFEALQGIFAGITAGEAEVLAALARAELEPDLAVWVAALDRAGWDVVVASAGCEWYIRHILAGSGVSLPIHANPGQFVEGGGLRMELPVGSPYFCAATGIDKAAIVQSALDAGRGVAFAGDGYPDVDAARRVPVHRRFARADLAEALQREGLPYRPFDRWAEVARALCEETEAEQRE